MNIKLSTLRKMILIFIFIIFLYPIGMDELSVNYSFLALPLVYLLTYSNIRKPQEIYLLLMGLYMLIFIIASIYQYELYGEGLRRITSFVLFMSMFSYMFVRINTDMIESFKVSVVVISLYFSLVSIHTFILLGGSDYGFGIKTMVGGQRFGFIYLLGIWLTYSYQSRERRYVVVKYSILLILLVGLFLTFSRSSIVGLFGSFGLFAFFNGLKWLRRPNVMTFSKGLAAFVAVAILIVLLSQLVPITFTFFEERLLSFVSNPTEVSEHLADSESSEGTRVYILGQIIDYILKNPLTGSGYLGVWILNDERFGSAHNQYADVLFRTGLLGFMVFTYLIFLLLRYLFSKDRALFWGLISVLIYSMFHETFKESQGQVVLAFLLGMMSQQLRKNMGDSVSENIVNADPSLQPQR